MKPKSLLFVFLPLFLISLFYACNKNDKQPVQIDPNLILIEEARDYFEKEALPDTLPQSPTVESNKLPVDKLTKWDKANIQDLRWGKTVVVPLNLPNSYITSDNGKTKKNISRTSFLVIYTDKDKAKHAEVVLMIPDKNATLKSFSGMIIVENWNGEILESYKYENGYEYKVTTTVVDKNKKNPKTEQTCVDTDWYTCTYYGGALIGCNYTRTTTQCTGSCCGGTCGRGGCWPAPREGEDDPGGPGGGGTSGTAPQFKDITDSLKTPCFKNVLSDASNGALINTVSKILLNTFGVGDKININFREAPIADLTTDGTTDGYSAGGYINIEVTLNNLALKNASKEYIAATILHEVLHGYFIVKKLNPLIEHNEMGLYYIEEMAKGIREIYPSMKSGDETALAWGGVAESFSWKKLLAEHPYTAGNISQVNDNYKNKGAGIKCP